MKQFGAFYYSRECSFAMRKMFPQNHELLFQTLGNENRQYTEMVTRFPFIPKYKSLWPDNKFVGFGWVDFSYSHNQEKGIYVKVTRADYLRIQKRAQARGIKIEDAIHQMIAESVPIITPIKHHWTAEEILRREG